MPGPGLPSTRMEVPVSDNTIIGRSIASVVAKPSGGRAPDHPEKPAARE